MSEQAEAAHAAERRRAFGQKLRTLREQTGKSQAAVARAAHMDRSFYMEIESGKYSVSVARLEDIATALGLPVRVFFEDPPASPQPEGQDRAEGQT